MRDLPPGARLSLLLVMASCTFVCGAIGSWLTPSTLALFHAGLPGLGQVETKWGIFAMMPTWLDPRVDPVAYNASQAINGILGFAAVAIGLVGGGRLWAFVVVKKLRWVTEAQLAYLQGRDVAKRPQPVVKPITIAAEEAGYRLDAWDILWFAFGLACGIAAALVLRLGATVASFSGIALALASLRARRHLVQIPDLTAQERAFTSPKQRLKALLMIALGITFASVGLIATAAAGIAVASSGSKYLVVLTIPLAMLLLGIALTRFGMRSRPRH